MLVFYAVLSILFAAINVVALVFTIHRPVLNMYSFTAMHLIMVIMLFAVSIVAIKDNRDHLPFYMALFLPGVGMVVFSAVTCFVKRTHEKSEQLSEYEKYIAYIDSLIKPDEINFTKQVNLMSGIDELIYSSNKRKKESIVDLMNNEAASKIKILKQALHDRDPEVVHYASMVLVSAEEEYEKKIAELESKYKQGRDPVVLTALSDIYRRYIDSGLLEGETLDIFLNDYLKLLLESEKTADGNCELLLAIADVYTRLHSYDKAVEILQRLNREFPEEPKVYLSSMKLYYDMHNYREVSKVAKKIKELDLGVELPEEYRKVASYWV